MSRSGVRSDPDLPRFRGLGSGADDGTTLPPDPTPREPTIPPRHPGPVYPEGPEVAVGVCVKFPGCEGRGGPGRGPGARECRRVGEPTLRLRVRQPSQPRESVPVAECEPVDFGVLLLAQPRPLPHEDRRVQREVVEREQRRVECAEPTGPRAQRVSFVLHRLPTLPLDTRDQAVHASARLVPLPATSRAL